MDRWGRLADRSALQHLGWPPGRRASISLVDGGIAVARPDGPHRIGVHGHLSLTASVRRALGLRTNDRLLLVACFERQTLAIYSVAVIEDAILDLHRRHP